MESLAQIGFWLLVFAFIIYDLKLVHRALSEIKDSLNPTYPDCLQDKVEDLEVENNNLRGELSKLEKKYKIMISKAVSGEGPYRSIPTKKLKEVNCYICGKASGSHRTWSSCVRCTVAQDNIDELEYACECPCTGQCNVILVDGIGCCDCPCTGKCSAWYPPEYEPK